MKRYTHLVWDFNGTLIDDVASDFGAANRLLKNHGLPEMKNVEEYRAVFGFPVADYYRRLGFDFSKVPFAELAREWWADYSSRSETATLYPEILQILREIKARGIPQIVLSATEREMLQKQLAGLGIAEMFDEILGADNTHAYGKADLARQWKEKHPNAVPLMIGDTDHDAETARAMGADIILLSCGHQAREKLEAANPLMICERPKDVPFEKIFFVKKRRGKIFRKILDGWKKL